MRCDDFRPVFFDAFSIWVYVQYGVQTMIGYGTEANHARANIRRSYQSNIPNSLYKLFRDLPTPAPEINDPLARLGIQETENGCGVLGAVYEVRGAVVGVCGPA